MPNLGDRYATEKKPWIIPDDIYGEKRVVAGSFELATRADASDKLWLIGEDQFLYVDRRFIGPALVKLLGADSDGWAGKPFIIFTETYTRRDGTEGRALRVKAAPDTPAPPPPPVLTEAEKRARLHRDLDDEIPF